MNHQTIIQAIQTKTGKKAVAINHHLYSIEDEGIETLLQVKSTISDELSELIVVVNAYPHARHAVALMQRSFIVHDEQLIAKIAEELFLIGSLRESFVHIAKSMQPRRSIGYWSAHFNTVLLNFDGFPEGTNAFSEFRRDEFLAGVSGSTARMSNELIEALHEQEQVRHA